MSNIDDKIERGAKVAAASFALFDRFRAWRKARAERKQREAFYRAIARLVEVSSEAAAKMRLKLDEHDARLARELRQVDDDDDRGPR